MLGEAVTPGGERVTLAREAGALVVRVAGAVLMSSRVHGSEEALAAVGCGPLAKRPRARVLVGGLGMGFTLRAALDVLGADAQVTVSELLPCVCEWNRGPLGPLADHPLDDRRCRLVVGDLAALLRASRSRFDAILLDVDNGPDAFTVPSNAWLYGRTGLSAIRTALAPAGVVVVWSAFESPRFEKSLRSAGFSLDVVPVRARGAVKKGSKHVLYVGPPARS